MTRFDSRSVRRWLWVSGALMSMLMVRARATPADVAGIVPTERRPELRRRLLVCVIAFIVAFLVGLLPIPFVSSVSPTQRWIELIAPPRNPYLQYLGKATVVEPGLHPWDSGVVI